MYGHLTITQPPSASIAPNASSVSIKDGQLALFARQQSHISQSFGEDIPLFSLALNFTASTSFSINGTEEQFLKIQFSLLQLQLRVVSLPTLSMNARFHKVRR